MRVRLNLVVLRAEEPERLAAFYSALGLSFGQHRHGAGPEHWASEKDGMVFEIYPASPKNPTTSGVRLGFAVELSARRCSSVKASPKNRPTAGVRLGFAVEDVAGALDRLVAAGAVVISGVAESPWGVRAVIQDPEGHKVELTEPLPAP